MDIEIIEGEVMPEDGLSRTIYVFGDICEEMAEQFTYDLQDLAKLNPKKEVQVVICTEGGCLYSMFAMHDIMRSVGCPVCTIGVGKIMSAGALLLSAGDKRLIFPNSSVMIHQPINESLETSIAQFKKEVGHFDQLYDQMTSLYSEYTGKSIEQIKTDLENEERLYFTAEEAIEYGFADELCTLRKRLRPKARKKKVTSRSKR